MLRIAEDPKRLTHGAPVNDIGETLGHSTIAITAMYLHVAPGKSSGRYLAS